MQSEENMPRWLLKDQDSFKLFYEMKWLKAIYIFELLQ